MSSQSDLLIQHDVPLCRSSNFQIGGPAKFFSQPKNREELTEVLDFQASKQLPYMIIGRGSNILFPDEGYEGLIVSLQKFEWDHLYLLTPETIKISSGVSMFRLSSFCQQKGLGGLEFSCHIPGTLGGAIWMNAGFGRPGRPFEEMKTVVETVTVLSPDRTLRVLNRDEIRFEYRSSHLDDYLILDATLHVCSSTPTKVREEVRSNFAYRNSVQDLRYPSAGSVFKNPKKQSKCSAGQLIEQVGLKGTRVGGAVFSEKHANFIINVGQARASDVLELMEEAKKRVFESFGVFLEPEIKIVSARAEKESAVHCG